MSGKLEYLIGMADFVYAMQKLNCLFIKTDLDPFYK